jgi:hypothetical protein
MHANTHVHTHVFLLTFRPGIRPRWWLLSGLRFGDVASQLPGKLQNTTEDGHMTAEDCQMRMHRPITFQDFANY